MPDPVIVSYPFDTTGILQSNRVLDELHAVTENNFRDYYFIVPKFSPFFANNIVITHSYGGNTRTLVENIDYYCALLFIGATRAIGKPVYGAITLNNLNTSGVISITYNTLGGDWVVDQQYVIEQIAEKAYNPRTVSWEHIVGVSNFPPVPHPWELVDLVGQTEIVGKLGDIEAAILAASQSTTNTHLTNFNNPHYVTKTQLGLSNVQNWSIASESETLEGIVDDKLITPLKLKVAILASDQLAVAAHVSDFNNPHVVTKEQLGLGNIENWSIASETETLEGVLDDKLITPLKLKTVSSLFYSKADVDNLLNSIKPLVASRAKSFFMAQL